MRTTTKLVKSVSLKYRHLKMGHFFLIWMMFNPFHAFPGPCPGILILITMLILDSVRASLQLIHYMLNSCQVWFDTSSVLQNIMGVYYGAIW